MIKLHIWKLRAPVQPSGRSKPYYGNYVQPKFNRLDARATPSGHGLVMEAFSAILERRLQLTVRMLGQVVRTPSGILIITVYSNIGLGQNWHRWKANKQYYKLSVWTAIISVRTESVRMETSGIRTAAKILEILFGQGKSCPSEWQRLPSRRVCHRIHFLLDLGLLKPINKGF
jgi:hypothetical protein